jgi:hypothetical protein
MCLRIVSSNKNISIGLYHPLDGITNLKYTLLCFLTPNKKSFKEKALAFNWGRCCHLVLCLLLILFYCNKSYVIEEMIIFEKAIKFARKTLYGNLG